MVNNPEEVAESCEVPTSVGLLNCYRLHHRLSKDTHRLVLNSGESAIVPSSDLSCLQSSISATHLHYLGSHAEDSRTQCLVSRRPILGAICALCGKLIPWQNVFCQHHQGLRQRLDKEYWHRRKECFRSLPVGPRCQISDLSVQKVETMTEIQDCFLGLHAPGFGRRLPDCCGILRGIC